MAYNKYRWWTKGRKKKVCSPSTPLILKIKNGDFDYCYMFEEINEVKEEYKKAYDKAYKVAVNKFRKEEDRHDYAHEEARMKRIKIRKLEEQAFITEEKILNALRHELHKTFREDLWDEAITKVDTIEEVYKYYHDTILKNANTKSFNNN